MVARRPRDPDSLLEAESDQAGEEEGAEGVDVVGDEVALDGGAGGAPRVPVEGVVRVPRVPGEPDEDGEREEGVHVHHAVERRHLDARAAGHRGVSRGGGRASL